MTCRFVAVTRPAVPHQPFLERLSTAERGDSTWRALVGGHAALQLFDVWVGNGCGEIPVSALEIRRVRKHVSAIEDAHAIRRCLTSLVDVIHRAPSERESDARQSTGYEAGRLLASYGRLLQFDGAWSLAEDVFETLLAGGCCVNDDEQLLDATLMLGYSVRMQGKLDHAAEVYASLRSAAIGLGNVRYELESRLSDAKVVIDRGNLPAARDLLERVTADARRAECKIVLGKALLESGRVRTILGEYEQALTFSYQALDVCVDAIERDRVLTNVAATFSLMGMWQGARDANLILAATAQEQEVRAMATINLMELAYFERNEVAFDQYRRQLAPMPMTARTEVVYYETLGDGYRAFERPAKARATYARMLAAAARSGLNEFVVKAEASLADIARSTRFTPPRVLERNYSSGAEVTQIAAAVAEMRVAAGIDEATSLGSRLAANDLELRSS